MKNLGLVLLAIGVGLCGAFGARTSTGMHAYLSAVGAVAMHDTVSEVALTAYCALGGDEPLPEQELCPSDEEEAVEDTAEGSGEEAADEVAAVEEEAGPTAEEILAQERELFARYRAVTVTLPDGTASARNDWLDAREAHFDARAVSLERSELPAPGVRLNRWASKNGLPFGLGLLLVIAGSVMARVDQKKRVTSGGSSDASGPVDFAALLGEVVTATASLNAQMAGIEEPTADDFESVKTTIDSLKLDQIERLIEARFAVQARYGLGSYANIFGPLSGGERLLNRAWAAATDLHWPESTASAKAAEESLRAALAQVPTA